MTNQEAADLFGTHERQEILKRLAIIEKLLDALLAAIPRREVITVSQIRTALGVGRDWLRVRPWALPNYGISDLPGKPRKWLIETWQAWKAVGFESHERAWLSMSEAQRHKIVSEAAV
jgi:hypothetical protein